MPWKRPFESAATPGVGSALQRKLVEQVAVHVSVKYGRLL
jgi:hypothetical protein